jgi:hypothetical protein
MRFLAWLFIIAAFVAFVLGIVLKIFAVPALPFVSDLYPMYPHSYMYFAEVSLLFAIALLLVKKGH